MAQEVIVINEYDDLTVSERRRTSAKGVTKNRTTIEIKSEPLVHTFDDTAMGAGPAEAIRDLIQRQIEDIDDPASPATIAFRKRAEKAYAEGAGWARERYRPLRGGASDDPPNSFKRGVKFNDSGRLAKGMFVRQNPAERNFTINVPAHRLTDDTRHLAPELVRLVPALNNPSSINDDAEFNKAIEESWKMMIAKAQNQTDLRRVRLRQQQMMIAKALFGLARSLGGM